MRLFRAAWPVALLVLALLLLTGWARKRMLGLPADQGERIKEVLLVPPGKVIRKLDLGYHSLAADLLFIRANLYYGQHMYTDEQLPWMADFIDVLMEVDPRFEKIYLWGALVTTHNKRQIDSVPEALVERANRILEAGMRQFPEDHRFPMRLAFNYMYELGDSEQALPYFVEASRLPGAPAWLGHKLVDIYSRQGRARLARKVLEQVIMEEEDPALSRALEERAMHLMEPEERAGILAQRAEIIDRWQESYPFLPLDLYLLIAEP